MAELVGVSELARRLAVGKGTLSKQAAAGKIPIAGRDGNGHPLFDVDAVRLARDDNLNPLMKRDGHSQGDHLAPSGNTLGGGDEIADDERAERRSVGPRPPSALVEQQKLEKQLKNRRLLRQVAEDEGLFVLRSEAENIQTTLARQTRDGVAAALADYSAKLYAFVSAQPRNDAELRVWLTEHVGLAFDQAERAIYADQSDEFDDGSESAERVEPGAPGTV